ncbi:MAG TPA: hypothetical protein VG206_12740 [Terriglobia bacterium]|nr:hypothetical protein [Terriglobia bacterium]
MAVPSRARRLAITAIVAVTLSASTLTRRFPWAQTGSSRFDEIVFESYRRAEPLTNWPLKKLLHEIPDLKGLEPAADQSPLPGILTRVSANVEALLANFMNTTALETIEETRTRNYPADQDSVVQRFRYLMLLKQWDSANHLVEYRTDLHGREERTDPLAQGFVKTVGFASMPLYLGSERQPLSDFRYLGSQIVGGHRLEVLAFAEHPEPSAARSFIALPGGIIPAILQGVAWIDSGNYEVVRMRTDLLAPLLTIRLGRETTEVRFKEVTFPKAPAPLWLPEEVDVTVGLEGLTYMNRHHYSDYEVFNVSTDQQIGAPKAAARP